MPPAELDLAGAALWLLDLLAPASSAADSTGGDNASTSNVCSSATGEPQSMNDETPAARVCTAPEESAQDGLPTVPPVLLRWWLPSGIQSPAEPVPYTPATSSPPPLPFDLTVMESPDTGGSAAGPADTHSEAAAVATDQHPAVTTSHVSAALPFAAATTSVAAGDIGAAVSASGDCRGYHPLGSAFTAASHADVGVTTGDCRPNGFGGTRDDAAAAVAVQQSRARLLDVLRACTPRLSAPSSFVASAAALQAPALAKLLLAVAEWPADPFGFAGKGWRKQKAGADRRRDHPALALHLTELVIEKKGKSPPVGRGGEGTEERCRTYPSTQTPRHGIRSPLAPSPYFTCLLPR